MGGIRAGLRPIYTFPITINTFSNILKWRLAGILISNSMSCTIIPTISSFKLMYTEKSTIFTCVMRGRVASLVPISNSSITTKNVSRIARVKVAGLFKPRSASNITNSYIHPWVVIILDSISPPIIIIRNYINLLYFMKIFLYTKRR